jgi:Tol biopolymer transport system component/DNA-binding winged helix-turn-helix (wHTH) protein
LDSQRRLLLKDGKPLALKPKAFDLLLVLVEYRGQMVEKDDLMSLVWQDQIVEENNLTVHMSALRKVLGERKGDHRFIVTVPGHGYRFVGDVREERTDGEVVFETHTVSRITIEEDEPKISADITDAGEGIDDPHADKAPASQPSTRATMQLQHQSTPVDSNRAISLSLSKLILLCASVLIVTVLIVLAVSDWRVGGKKQATFEQRTISRLTNSGKVAAAAISSDGKYLVYAQAEKEGQSLWLQHIDTGSTARILPPQDAIYWGLRVSPDNSYIYCSTFAGNKVDDLFRIPILGGAKEHLPVNTNTSVSFSPDGKQMVYTDSHGLASSLMIADADGSNQYLLASSMKPENFWCAEAGSPVAWSPDGKTIACSINGIDEQGSYMTIAGVSPGDGTRRLLTPRRWDLAWHLNWLADSRTLVFTARERPSGEQQVWKLSLDTGETHQITNDLNGYEWLGITGDSQTLMAVQRNIVSHIRVISPESMAKSVAVQPLHTESQAIANVSWLPDGRILYTSKASGKSELWMINADGTSPAQLTVEAKAGFGGLALSPDGRHIIFASTRAGRYNIWRVNIDGLNFKQLTAGNDIETWPSISADGQWVIYQRGGYGIAPSSIWKVPIQGGEPIQINSDHIMRPVASPTNEHVAFYCMDDSSGESVWGVCIISVENGSLIKKMNVPRFISERVMRWTPDGRSLTHVHNASESGKLLLFPLDESESRELTGLGRGNINSFAWSGDGMRVVVSQSVESRDLVLIKDLR